MNPPVLRRFCRGESVARIECLEPRIAPASLTFTDADGDAVTITTSKGTLTAGAGGNVKIVDGTLQELDLTDPAFQGSDVTITTKEGATGGMRDGLVKVGRIKADGRDLGEVKIQGDLGQIDAGDADPKNDGVKSLEVESLGKSGTDTQAAGGDLKSEIRGRLGKLKVKTDIKEASLDVIGEANGRIGKIEIGGNVTGGAADGSGAIRATGSIDSVSIGGNLEGSGGANSGQIQSSGKFKKIVIKGNIAGAPAPVPAPSMSPTPAGKSTASPSAATSRAELARGVASLMAGARWAPQKSVEMSRGVAARTQGRSARTPSRKA